MKIFVSYITPRRSRLRGRPKIALISDGPDVESIVVLRPSRQTHCKIPAILPVYVAPVSLIYGAASPRRRPLTPPWYAPPGARPLLCQHSHTRNSTPQARPLAVANGGGGAGGITHNTWNHKTGNHRGGVLKDNPQHREPQGPFPSDTQMRMMAMMLRTMTLMCYAQCGCWW